MSDAEVDFPFRVSPAEQRIIELNAPESIILLGRSGTGKTTCAVFRMFAHWLASWREGQPFNMVRSSCLVKYQGSHSMQLNPEFIPFD